MKTTQMQNLAMQFMQNAIAFTYVPCVDETPEHIRTDMPYNVNDETTNMNFIVYFENEVFNVVDTFDCLEPEIMTINSILSFIKAIAK